MVATGSPAAHAIVLALAVVLLTFILLAALVSAKSWRVSLLPLIIALLSGIHIVTDLPYQLLGPSSWTVTAVGRLTCGQLILLAIEIIGILTMARGSRQKELRDWLASQQLASETRPVTPQSRSPSRSHSRKLSTPPISNEVNSHRTSTSTILKPTTRSTTTNQSPTNYRSPSTFLYWSLLSFTSSFLISVLLSGNISVSEFDLVVVGLLALHVPLLAWLLWKLRLCPADWCRSKRLMQFVTLVCLPLYTLSMLVAIFDTLAAAIVLYLTLALLSLALMLTPLLLHCQRTAMLASIANDSQAIPLSLCDSTLTALTRQVNDSFFDYLLYYGGLSLYECYADLSNVHLLVTPSHRPSIKLSTFHPSVFRILHQSSKPRGWSRQAWQRLAMEQIHSTDELLEQLERVLHSIIAIKTRWLSAESADFIQCDNSLVERLNNDFNRIRSEIQSASPSLAGDTLTMPLPSPSSSHSNSPRSIVIDVGTPRSFVQLLLECDELLLPVERWLSELLCREFVRPWLMANGGAKNEWIPRVSRISTSDSTSTNGNDVTTVAVTSSNSITPKVRSPGSSISVGFPSPQFSVVSQMVSPRSDVKVSARGSLLALHQQHRHSLNGAGTSSPSPSPSPHHHQSVFIAAHSPSNANAPPMKMNKTWPTPSPQPSAVYEPRHRLSLSATTLSLAGLPLPEDALQRRRTIELPASSSKRSSGSKNFIRLGPSAPSPYPIHNVPTTE